MGGIQSKAHHVQRKSPDILGPIVQCHTTCSTLAPKMILNLQVTRDFTPGCIFNFINHLQPQSLHKCNKFSLCFHCLQDLERSTSLSFCCIYIATPIPISLAEEVHGLMGCMSSYHRFGWLFNLYMYPFE